MSHQVWMGRDHRKFGSPTASSLSCFSLRWSSWDVLGIGDLFNRASSPPILILPGFIPFFFLHFLLVQGKILFPPVFILFSLLYLLATEPMVPPPIRWGLLQDALHLRSLPGRFVPCRTHFGTGWGRGRARLSPLPACQPCDFGQLGGMPWWENMEGRDIFSGGWPCDCGSMVSGQMETYIYIWLYMYIYIYRYVYIYIYIYLFIYLFVFQVLNLAMILFMASSRHCLWSRDGNSGSFPQPVRRVFAALTPFPPVLPCRAPVMTTPSPKWSLRSTGWPRAAPSWAPCCT